MVTSQLLIQHTLFVHCGNLCTKALWFFSCKPNEKNPQQEEPPCQHWGRLLPLMVYLFVFCCDERLLVPCRLAHILVPCPAVTFQCWSLKFFFMDWNSIYKMNHMNLQLIYWEVGASKLAAAHQIPAGHSCSSFGLEVVCCRADDCRTTPWRFQGLAADQMDRVEKKRKNIKCIGLTFPLAVQFDW